MKSEDTLHLLEHVEEIFTERVRVLEEDKADAITNIIKNELNHCKHQFKNKVK